MQNLLTNQEPEGAYNTDLLELQKNCHLTTIWLGQIRKPHFLNKHILWDIIVYTKLSVCEDLESIIQAISSH